MVFSKLCYRHKRLGQGVIVPFLRPTESFDGLQQEVDFLARAEGLGSSWEWGAVGLLARAPSKFPGNLLQEWARYFKAMSPQYEGFAGHTRSEQPIITRDGLLTLRWPLSIKDADKFDFLLGTPTKARMDNRPRLKRYPNPAEIAKFLLTDKTNYFIKNALRGIRTPKDEAIWKTLTRIQPRFAAKWPQIASLVSERDSS